MIPGAGNILTNDGRVTLLDWDEARVDVPWFDLAALPVDVALLGWLHLRDVGMAGVAWAAATSWTAEPDYARQRAEELARLM